MTTKEVKSRLVEYLEGRESLDSLQAWLLPTSQGAGQHGREFEILLGSVGYLFARLSAGSMSASDFVKYLRVLSTDMMELPTQALVQRPAASNDLALRATNDIFVLLGTAGFLNSDLLSLPDGNSVGFGYVVLPPEPLHSLQTSVSTGDNSIEVPLELLSANYGQVFELVDAR